jgi:hypothetical protein
MWVNGQLAAEQSAAGSILVAPALREIIVEKIPNTAGTL